MIKPIYCELSEELENYINKRNLKGRLPGLGVLSKKFGVHQVTMSKAVKLLEKKGVLTVNGTRGTFINERTNSRPVYKVIGIVGLSHIREQEYFIARLSSAVKKSGYTPIGLTISRSCFEDNPEMLSSFPVNGFLFCCSSLTNKMARHLHQAKIPFVVCNRRPDIDWINTLDFDHEAICEEVIKYLRQLGHHRIAYISPATSEEYKHHAQWMRDIIKKAQNGDFVDELFYDFPANWHDLFVPEKTVPEIKRMLHYFASLPEMPTAIIAPSALGSMVIEQLKESGVKCPEDISVFAYGVTDKPEEGIAYSLFDYDKLWLAGIRQMVRIFSGMEKEPITKLLKMPIVPGKSVGKVSQTNNFKARWS